MAGKVTRKRKICPTCGKNYVLPTCGYCRKCRNDRHRAYYAATTPKCKECGSTEIVYRHDPKKLAEVLKG